MKMKYTHCFRMIIAGFLCSLAFLSASACASSAIISRLNASDFKFNGSSYSGKKSAMITIAECLLDDGFEPAFAAGVMANVACEGSFGKFENITGYTQTRLLQVFPKLKTCAESGNSHQNYIAHIKGFSDYDGCGHDHSEYAAYSNKYIYNGFSLSAIESMINRYASESWKAKFGLGSMQWTGGRTKTLFSFYKAEAGSADTITYAQCGTAEMKMIRYELSNSHKSVYTNWKKANTVTASEDAAYDAGYRVCYYYEIPANRATASVTRGKIAREIYTVMMPESMPEGAIDTVKSNGDGTITIAGRFADASDPDAVFTVNIYLNGTLAETVTADASGHRFSSVIDTLTSERIDQTFTVSAVACLPSAPTVLYDVPVSSGVSAVVTARYSHTLQLPASLGRVQAEAFRGNAAQYIIIPEGVTAIEAYAFADCDQLLRIDIPDSVTSIAAAAFSASPNVTIVCSKGSIAATRAAALNIPYITK